MRKIDFLSLFIYLFIERERERDLNALFGVNDIKQ